MIASKGQTVRLIGGTQVAIVVSVLTSGPGYDSLPDGERGVKLSRPLDGSVWSTEEQIESAESS